IAHFEGRFAIWTALTAATDQELSVATQRILALKERLAELDFIDQVEVLAAAAFVATRTHDDPRPSYDSLRHRLAALPPAAANQILRQGSLGITADASNLRDGVGV
ncbi:MAG TPA: hypothetical protein VFW66_09855, partial [Gemmatimonadales bacterium]|nr:hypothetical protein [Gemmatimonadales bacterium]